MDHGTEDPNRLPEIVKYFQANPTIPAAEAGAQHIHIHHHYAPPAPPLPPPKRTVAEQVMPWLYVSLLACIILTICSLILAVVMVALLVGLAGAAILGVVITYLIKSTRESQINLELARQGRSAPRKRTR